MDQVVILILFVVASIVSSIIQNRNKRQAEAEEKARRAGGQQPRAEEPRPPFQQWPKSARDWQEELRRMLEDAAGAERPVPPVVVPQHKPKPAAPPVIAAPKAPRSEPEIAEGDMTLASRLKDSEAAYARASGLHDRVQDRLREVVQATEAHLPRVQAERARWSPWAARFRDQRSVRDAFVASVILSPPLALQSPGDPRW